MYKDYIIDFDRVNELTTIIYDEKEDTTNPFSNGKVGFTLSRSIIKDYLKIFQEGLRRSNSVPLPKTLETLEHVIKTLEYNGVLISDSTIRDQKIDKILKT